MSLSILSEATATQNKAKARALRAGVELVYYNEAELLRFLRETKVDRSIPQSENVCSVKTCQPIHEAAGWEPVGR
jgi:hypothetical protein